MRALCVAALIAAMSTIASAESSYQVHPTTVSLSSKEPTEAVVITNHGNETLRVQLEMMPWTEDRAGQRFWLYRDGLYRETNEPRWFMHGLFA